MLSSGRLLPLMVCWCAIAVIVFGGGLYSTDVQAQLEVSGSLLGQRPLLTAEHGWTVEGRAGGSFVPHGVGYSLVLLPAAAAGIIAGSGASGVCVSLINSLMSLLLFLLLVILVEKEGGRTPRPSAMLLGAVCSMMPIYARLPFDVTAAAVFSCAAVVLSSRERNLEAGFAIGFALLTRLDSLVFLPALVAAGGGLRREKLRLVPGLLFFLLLTAAANAYRFGSPLEDGHGLDPPMALSAPLDGLAGLLASPGKGLIWYAPLSLVAVFPAARTRRRAIIYLSPFILSLVLHSFLRDWSGGTGWGPRFLFPQLPLLFVPLLASVPRRGWVLALIRVALVWSLLICLAGVWSSPTALEQRLGPDLFDDPGRQEVLWKPSRSPLLVSLTRLGRGEPDLLAWRASGTKPSLVWPLAGLQVGAAMALGIAGIVLHRKRRVKRPDEPAQ